jgi:transposase
MNRVRYNTLNWIMAEKALKGYFMIIRFIPRKVYVTLDRRYDSKKLRRKSRHRKAFQLIPKQQIGTKIHRRTPKPFIYKLRWIMEQAFSRTDPFRKLLVRQERNSFNYKQYWYFGLAVLEIQKLTGYALISASIIPIRKNALKKVHCKT